MFLPHSSNPAFQINTSFSKWHKQAKAVPVSDPDCIFSDSPALSPPHLTDTLSDSAGCWQDTHSEDRKDVTDQADVKGALFPLLIK